MIEHLIESLLNCPIVKKGEYNYFVHPITDGIPNIDPMVLREVAVGMIRLLDLKNVKYIVAAEAMAIPIGTAISLITDIPLNIIRKRSYGLPGEQEVVQETGYSKGQMFVNGLCKGDRVVIVDDVISTGGTINGILATLGGMGVEVSGICFAIKKGTPKVDMPYHYLVAIEVTDAVRIVDQTL
ncbi:MAG: adenine phosphoribosyltransferase [Methanomicrobiales archaeon HGW-Methanomicrobiales-4]|nr:MAG: adenine phosphoribosyltransferase [Methanomicrobiales archaeon HGW-Methanomicrobiales-4]